MPFAISSEQVYGTYLPQGIYGARLLFFVSARTNKRHHHDLELFQAIPGAFFPALPSVPRPILAFVFTQEPSFATHTELV